MFFRCIHILFMYDYLYVLNLIMAQIHATNFWTSFDCFFFFGIFVDHIHTRINRLRKFPRASTRLAPFSLAYSSVFFSGFFFFFYRFFSVYFSTGLTVVSFFFFFCCRPRREKSPLDDFTNDSIDDHEEEFYYTEVELGAASSPPTLSHRDMARPPHEGKGSASDMLIIIRTDIFSWIFDFSIRLI